MRGLQDLDLQELRSLLRRYRSNAAVVRPGEEPSVWDSARYEDVRAEFVRRGVTNDEIDEFTWGLGEGDD